VPVVVRHDAGELVTTTVPGRTGASPWPRSTSMPPWTRAARTTGGATTSPTSPCTRNTAAVWWKSPGDRYHQQYLARNKDGYCGIGGTGVTCPVGFTEAVEEAAKSASTE
jgi:hypothetical protein